MIRVGRSSFCTTVLVVATFLLGCEPQERRPGFWLSGEVVEAAVTDWSFSDGIQSIFVETRTWYGIPHSVTTGFIVYGDSLYVASVYFEGGKFPDDRMWNRNLVRDRRVRLKIGDRIFEREARVVEDPAEFSGVRGAYGESYAVMRDLAAMPEAERPGIYFFRMDPRTPTNYAD
jgi:hypothetical protein